MAYTLATRPSLVLDHTRTAFQNYHVHTTNKTLLALTPDPRSPDVVTVQQIATLIANIAQIIEEEIPAPTLRKNVLKRLDSMTTLLRNAPRPPVPLTPAPLTS